MKNAASFEPVQPEQVKFIVNNNQINNNDSRIRVKQNKVIHVIVYSVVGLLLIAGLILLIFLLTNSSESGNLKKTNISTVNSASIFEPVPNVDRIVGPQAPNIEPIPVEIEKSTPTPRTVSNSVPNSVPSISQSIVLSSTKNTISLSVATINPKPNPTSIPIQNPSPIPIIIPNSISTLKPNTTQTSTPCPCAAAKPVSLPVADVVHKPSSNSVPVVGQISFASYSIPKATKVDSDLEKKRQFIKDMFLESWNAYRSVAWGNEALKPVTNTTYSKTFGDDSGLTIVTAMSTLWTMGLMDEFGEGKAWIKANLDLSKLDRDVLVFDTVAHYVGGLLSCYSLTGDSFFLNKALQISQLVEPAFSTPTGIPYEKINLNSGSPMDENPLLSNVGGFLVDFNYLSDISGQQKYRGMVSKIFKLLHDMTKPQDLYYSVVNIDGTFGREDSSPFAESREFYVNLVKSYIQSNRKDVQSIEMFKKVIEAMENVRIIGNAADVYLPGSYVARRFSSKTNKTSRQMEYSSCYLGAIFMLASNAMQQTFETQKLTDFEEIEKKKDEINHLRLLSEALTDTCYAAASSPKTKLPFSAFTLYDWTSVNRLRAATQYKSYHDYYLSPEGAESYFTNWRFTHNTNYRAYAWEMANAIKQHCHVQNGGYSGIINVWEIPAGFHDYQSPLFLSATLKYLYLAFTDDTVFPLDQWIFNSVGHPLPICGKNPAYPSKICKHQYM